MTSITETRPTEDADVDITSVAPSADRKVTLQDWIGIFEIMASEQAKLVSFMTQFQNTPTPDGYETVTDILDDFDSAVCFLRNTAEAILIGAQDLPAFKDVVAGASKKTRKSKSKSPSSGSGSDIGSVKKRVSAEEKEAKAKERAEAKEAKAKAKSEEKASKAAAKAAAKAKASSSSDDSDSKQKKRKRSVKKTSEEAPANVPTSYEVQIGL
jgi:hypothetical protein